MNENTDFPNLTPPEPKHLNHKIIWTGVLLFAILVTAFLFYKWPFTKNDVSPSVDNQQNVISDISNNDLEVYYYTADDSSQQYTKYKIFKVSTDLEKQDTNTHSFNIAGRYSFVITESWKKNTILLLTNSETQAVIYSLDVSSQNSQPQKLLTIPLDNDKGEGVDSARFVDDGASIAFITSDGQWEEAENSVLNVISLQDQSKKESYPLNKRSPKYAGFGFLVATPDSKTIYLDETGGDGGAVWSQWYKVNRTTKVVQKLENLPPIAKRDRNPAASAFSPDRTKLAYADFSAAVDSSDLEPFISGADYKCLKYDDGGNLLQKYASLGGTVIVQDLKTGATNEVFRNLTYKDNYCKNIGNRIVSLSWLDNSRLAFETIDGVYALDVNTSQQQTLFTFEETFNPGQQTRPSIFSVQLPFIVFSDRSIAQTNTNKRLELVNPEAQEGYFFVLE